MKTNKLKRAIQEFAQTFQGLEQISSVDENGDARGYTFVCSDSPMDFYFDNSEHNDLYCSLLEDFNIDFELFAAFCGATTVYTEYDEENNDYYRIYFKKED